MDRFILRYVLIKFIRVFDRAVFCTGGTTRAFVLQNIPGLFSKRYLKVSYFSLYTVNFSIGENLYIGMPADLDQLGCEYSHGAVIGRKGLIKLSHMAPDARCLLDQVHLKTRRSEIKRGLNTADPSPNNHYVSKLTVPETLTKLLNIVFERYDVFHFLSPHQVLCSRTARVNILNLLNSQVAQGGNRLTGGFHAPGRPGQFPDPERAK